MESENDYEFKTYLKRKEEHVIRRFSIKKKFSNNFQYLVNKIKSIFPELCSKEFQVMWNDSEDMVYISSNEELILALSEMKSPLKKIYIKCVGKNNKKMGVAYCDLRFTGNIPNISDKMNNKPTPSNTPEHSIPSESQTNPIKPEGIKYMEFIAKLNDNIEQIRSHLISSNGAITEHYEESKLQALQLSMKKLQCIVDKLQDKRTAEKIVDSIVFPNVRSENKSKTVNAVELSERLLLNNQVNITTNSLLQGEMVNENNDMQNIASSSTNLGDKENSTANLTEGRVSNNCGYEMIDEVEHGSSVKTLSEASSDDENDKWTLLDNDNYVEHDSLPDITERLAALKCLGQDKHKKDEVEEDDIDSLDINSFFPENSTETSSGNENHLATHVTIDPQATVPVVLTTVPRIQTEVPVLQISVPTVQTSIPTELTSNLVVHTAIPRVQTEQTSVPLPQTTILNEGVTVILTHDADQTSSAHSASETQITSTENRAIFPHIAAGLEILYNMGFSSEDRNLVNLLEMYDGNVELVLDTLLFTDL